MSKISSAKYYQDNKERLHKNLSLKKEMKNNNNIFVKDKKYTRS